MRYIYSTAVSCIFVALFFFPQAADASITYVAASSLDTSGAAQHLSTPVYSTASTIEPGHLFILILGMRPSAANRGSVVTPPGWTLIASTTGGGYNTTLGADTGNMHLFAFAKVADGSERDTRLNITLENDNVTWANLFRLSNTAGAWDIATTTGEDTTGDATFSTTFDSDPGVTAGDYILGAAVIPTDAGTNSATWSAHALTQTGITFGAVTEAGEIETTTSLDLGGTLFHAPVSSGTSSAAPQYSATVAGTLTNMRGPVLFIRVREAAAPGQPTLYPDDGGANQIAFNNTRQNDTTPIVRASAVYGSTFDRFQVEFNTQADFNGTSYTETFSNTYSSATAYNLQTTGSLGLPTTDGVTYYIRVRASADAGSHWGAWSGTRDLASTASYTYKSSGTPDWFQTTSEQFVSGTTTQTRIATSTTNSIDVARLPYVSGFTTAATEDQATSITLIKPNGINPGDLLLILVGNDAANSTVQWNNTTNKPGGFTLINESGNTTSDSHDAAFYRIADGTEQTSTSTTHVTNADTWGYYIRVTGVDTSTPLDQTGADSCNAVATTCAITGITSSVANTLAFYMHSYDGGDGNPFGISGTGWVKGDGVNATGAAQTDAAAAGGSWGTRVTPGSSEATGNATVDSAVSDGFSGFQFNVQPANVTVGTTTSPVIDFDSYDGASGWNEASWSETETGGSIAVRVLGSSSADCDTEVIALTATSPIDLSSLTTTGAGQIHNRICLEAVLTHTSGSGPLLNDWGVSWTAGAGGSSPTVTTNFASNVGASSATLHGSITDNGGDDADEHGFAYSTDSTLSSSVSTTTLGGYTGAGNFNGGIVSLSPDTTYYFRAYATNGNGTGLGSIISFFTGNANITRTLRLFEGARLHLLDGAKMILHQR